MKRLNISLGQYIIFANKYGALIIGIGIAIALLIWAFISYQKSRAEEARAKKARAEEARAKTVRAEVAHTEEDLAKAIYSEYAPLLAAIPLPLPETLPEIYYAQKLIDAQPYRKTTRYEFVGDSDYYLRLVKPEQGQENYVKRLQEVLIARRTSSIKSGETKRISMALPPSGSNSLFRELLAKANENAAPKCVRPT